jgi:hypothetical protein
MNTEHKLRIAFLSFFLGVFTVLAYQAIHIAQPTSTASVAAVEAMYGLHPCAPGENKNSGEGLCSSRPPMFTDEAAPKVKTWSCLETTGSCQGSNGHYSCQGNGTIGYKTVTSTNQPYPDCTLQ